MENTKQVFNATFVLPAEMTTNDIAMLLRKAFIDAGIENFSLRVKTGKDFADGLHQSQFQAALEGTNPNVSATIREAAQSATEGGLLSASST